MKLVILIPLSWKSASCHFLGKWRRPERETQFPWQPPNTKQYKHTALEAQPSASRCIFPFPSYYPVSSTFPPRHAAVSRTWGKPTRFSASGFAPLFSYFNRSHHSRLTLKVLVWNLIPYLVIFLSPGNKIFHFWIRSNILFPVESKENCWRRVVKLLETFTPRREITT